MSSDSGGVAADQLRAFVERVERLEEEKKAISNDIKDVFAEAKGTGFDVKVMRQIIRMRKQEPHEREEFEAVLDLYMHALGMATDAIDANQEGRDAAETRHPVTTNSYTFRDPRKQQWADGWQSRTGSMAGATTHNQQEDDAA